MYECPNCAGNLRFDIKAQMLYCEHCEALMEPYHVEKEQDAEESPYFESTVYLCPQCGGQILCDDNTAATFCCYCGASTILTSRISQFRTPKYIIPFQRTVEDCKEAYQEMVKGAFFAPNEFKDVNALNRFRAIYMPYWVCDVEANKEINFEGISYGQDGSYRNIHHTEFFTHIRSKFEGLTFDASSALPDRLSTLIEPFYLSGKRPFTPSFLSGFYADTNDAEPKDYSRLAQNMAIDYCYDEFCGKYPNFRFEESSGILSLKEALDVHESKEALCMFPVWFLSYRKKNKVAYGVMNGQTGKVALELPIDIKKFVGTAILVSLPVILFLNLFFVIKPSTLLIIMTLLTSFLGLLANERIGQILNNEFYEDFQLKAKAAETKLEKKRKINKIVDIFFDFVLPCFGFLFGASIEFRYYLEEGGSWITPSTIWVLAVGLILYCLARRVQKGYRIQDISFQNKNAYKRQWKRLHLCLLIPFSVILMAVVVLLINPMSNSIYYTAFMIGMGLMIWTIFELIHIQNKTIMNPLPQFNTRGGDEDAYKRL